MYPSLSSPNGQAHTCGWYRELLPGVCSGCSKRTQDVLYRTHLLYAHHQTSWANLVRNCTLVHTQIPNGYTLITFI